MQLPIKKGTKLKAEDEQMRKKNKVAHGPITDAPKSCKKLIHISVELFSKKITGRKNKKDMRGYDELLLKT